MSAFDAACEVEALGMHALLPFIDRTSDGRYVLTSKGPLARHLQVVAGDVLMNAPHSARMHAIEVKCEQVNRWGKLFLETWSNRNFDSRASHGQYGANPGWLWHSRADWLFYYFVSSDELYIADFFALKQWAFGHGDTPGRLYDFEEKPQRKYAQANQTYGRCVPIRVLYRELGALRFMPVHAKQLCLGFAQARFDIEC